MTDWAFGDLPSLIAAALVLGPAGLAYVAITCRLGVPEATDHGRRVDAGRAQALGRLTARRADGGRPAGWVA